MKLTLILETNDGKLSTKRTFDWSQMPQPDQFKSVIYGMSSELLRQIPPRPEPIRKPTSP